MQKKKRQPKEMEKRYKKENGNQDLKKEGIKKKRAQGRIAQPIRTFSFLLFRWKKKRKKREDL